MPPHPLLSYYGPLLPPWPRILVFGYEANTHVPISDCLDKYNLEDGPVRLWSLSHTALLLAAGLTISPNSGWTLRQHAIQAKSSPIMYADASPFGKRYLNPKTGKRPKITVQMLEDQAAKFLGLPQMTRDRCPLVLMPKPNSSNKRWMPFFDALSSELQGRGTFVARPPIFAFAPGSKMTQLVEPLQEPGVRDAVRRVICLWAKANVLQLADAASADAAS